MTTSEQHFLARAQEIARSHAFNRQLENARQQTKTIVGDADAHWLLDVVKGLRMIGATVTSEESRRFHFLSDDAEVVMNTPVNPATYQAIDMPADCTVRKIAGTGKATSVYRVSNSGSGTRYEHIDVAYRKVGNDYLLYLKAHQRGERQSSGRSANVRYRGTGPDRSL